MLNLSFFLSVAIYRMLHVSTLLDLIQAKVNYVVKEAIIVIKVKTRLLLFTSNGPFASGQSRGTKLPNWRANDALEHVKHSKKIQIWWLCLTYSSASFALQFGNFALRDHSDAMGPVHLFLHLCSNYSWIRMNRFTKIWNSTN